MEYELNYGGEKLTVPLLDSLEVTVIRKPPMPLLADAVGAVRRALAQPVAAAPLADLARGRKSAAIAVCDITRPVPNHLFLRPMVETLQSSGVDDIVILIATGLHRPNLGSELDEIIGDPWVTKHVRVENHEARRDEQHSFLGQTPKRGTVVRIDRRFVEADLRIVTGLVEPHFMAGYSGGRKVIAPGLAHAETITTFHNGRFMADPGTRNGHFENNPLHEEQLAVVEMLGEVFALNTVIDESRALAFVNFGEVRASHEEAVHFVRRYAEVTVPRRFQTVVTSAAGYPLDRTYYQTIKGMVGPTEILEQGGLLIIASSCSEGLGSNEFREAQGRLKELGQHRFLQDLLQKKHASIDEWQTQMLLKPLSRGRVQLFTTGLSAQERELTGTEIIDDVAEQVAKNARLTGDPAVAVIPEGPYVIPVLKHGDYTS
jgi:nickel-dependent lactate racemase